MKHIFKLSVSLFLNQFLSVVAAGMCIIPSRLFFGNALTGSTIFLIVTLSFFAYIEYRAAAKSGFHDADRRNKPSSKAYLYKGFLAGAISVVPLAILVFLHFLFTFTGDITAKAIVTLFAGFASMYYAFPLSSIIPNHIVFVLLSSLLPPIIFPWIGYIAGYKNFDIFDIICKWLRIKPKV